MLPFAVRFVSTKTEMRVVFADDEKNATQRLEQCLDLQDATLVDVESVEKISRDEAKDLEKQLAQRVWILTRATRPELALHRSVFDSEEAARDSAVGYVLKADLVPEERHAIDSLLKKDDLVGVTNYWNQIRPNNRMTLEEFLVFKKLG